MDIVVKGQYCIAAAKKALELISEGGDASKAQKQLAVLREDGKLLQKVAAEAKDDCENKEKELCKELEEKTYEMKQYESKILSINTDKSREEAKRATQEKQISDTQYELRQAQSRLSDAESDLRRAKEKEKATMITSVAVGTAVGLVTFGVGGLLAGSAVGAGVAAWINKAEGRVRNARSDVRHRDSDISRMEQELSNTNSSLSLANSNIRDYQRRIAENEARIQDIHDKIGVIKESKQFYLNALHMWDLFTTAAASATDLTENLKQIVIKANATKRMRILTANSTIIKAESFMEAWAEVNKQGEILPITN